MTETSLHAGTDDPPPGGWIRLVWAGDLDLRSLPRFASSVRDAWEADPARLEVDLAGVTSMDRAGLRPLVEAHARLRDRMRLLDPSPAVTLLLGHLGLGDMFVLVGSTTTGPATGRSVAPTSGLPALVDDRATIEQAKGLLMAAHSCDASTAWAYLRSHAKVHDVRIRVMAQLLVDQAPRGLPPASDTVVEDVLAEFARSAPPAT